MKKKTRKEISKERIGLRFLTNEGEDVEIIECTGKRCTIRYLDGITVENIIFSNLVKGSVKKPYSRVGERHLTKQGYYVVILAHHSPTNCDIQFENGYIMKGIAYAHIKDKSIVNPFHPTVCGTGYIGEGKYCSSVDGVKSKVYDIWNKMIKRCYKKNGLTKDVTYLTCTVDEIWHNFQNYAKWYEENCKGDFHVDKDLLSASSKIYSPETCCFVPRHINNLLTKRQNDRGNYPIGVTKKGNKFHARLNRVEERKFLGSFDSAEEAFYAYKIAKEEYIKELADFYKDQITEACYNALYTYEVEITN